MAAAAAVVDIDRSEENHGENQFYRLEEQPAAARVAPGRRPGGWGYLYCRPLQRTASGHLQPRRRPFRPLSMPRSTMTRRRSSSFSDPMARTSSNPAIRPKTRIFAPSLRARLTKSSRSRRTALTPDRVTFTVGTQEWPFPVPVIRRDGKWQLDSAGGRLEILARRIGRNELNAMEVCRGYAEAQMEYAAAARDGDRVLKYAQKIAATPGKQDGLYADGVPDSLVSQAFAEAAAANPSRGARNRNRTTDITSEC